MTIKEEFEKAFEAEVKAKGYDSVESDPQMEQLLQKGKLALWAAKWMAEMCVKVVVVPGHPKIVKDIENQIRQLAKELD